MNPNVNAAALLSCITLAAGPVAVASPGVEQAGPPAGPGVFYETLEGDLPLDRYGEPVLSMRREWRAMCSGTEGLSTARLRAVADRHGAVFGAEAPPVPVGLQFNVILNLSNDVPPEVEQALEAAVLVLEQLFSDQIAITINVDWANLGGGVLGATGSSQASVSYASVRNMLIDDMDTSDSIQPFLPGGSTVPVLYDASSTNVSNENEVTVAFANLRAMGGTASQVVASMTFNSTFPWDLDPSDGIDSGTWDLQSVAVHEVGHAMGFISDVDDPGNSIAVLDLFRFHRTDGCCDYDPDDADEFSITPRLADFNAPDDAHEFDLGPVSTEHRLSDGNPYQASHFREQSPPIGVMDPAIGSGQSFAGVGFLTEADTDVFDAIGWDFPLENGTVPLPFTDDFPEFDLDPTLWIGNEGAIGSTRGANEPSPNRSLNLDATTPGGDQVRSAFMDTSAVSDLRLTYWYERTGNDDSPEPGDDLVVEFLDGQGVWVEVNRHLGSGPDMLQYEFTLVELPAEARHPAFRVRFRALSTENAADFDDHFVDDLCIGAAADCAEPSLCVWDCGDGNGIVDTVDFLQLLAEFGQVGTPCDFDDDGVTTVDFLALLANWGGCP